MEIPFEYLLAGIESARGTALATPTHYLGLAGTVTPQKSRYRPNESRGKLAEYYRSVDVRKWSEWEMSGPADVYVLPLLLNALVQGGIDGSGATEATLTTNLTGNNNDLLYTAVAGGGSGNAIAVTYIDPAANNQAEHVDVIGTLIKVWLATGVAGAITSTGDTIKASIAAHPVASTLVTAADAPANDGSGAVTAMSTTYLTGGAGAEVTTPGGATLSRLWTFTPDMTADTLNSLTLYWGDPNIQAFQAAFCMPDELTLTGDSGGEDGVTLSINGMGLFPSKTAPGAVPAVVVAPLLMPSAMQLWLDTSSAIGTTEVTGRIVKAEVTIPSGLSRKYLAQGPTGNLGFSDIGRGKRHVELKLTLEVPDMTQYDLFAAATSLKARLRFNGSLIEAGFYHYIEVDVYGPFEAATWGEFETSNRTIELNILSEYNTATGYDWCMRVQNDHDAL